VKSQLTNNRVFAKAQEIYGNFKAAEKIRKISNAINNQKR
jgi:hypothetical protein